MDIRQLVMESTNNQMSARPGYYSGRGATTSDLNSDLLNKIADGIKKEYGDQAHDSFVKMVWDTPSLSATAFLTNLYALHSAGWDLAKVTLPNDGNYIENHSEAFGLMAEVMSRSGSTRSDATEFIRRGFREPK